MQFKILAAVLGAAGVVFTSTALAELASGEDKIIIGQTAGFTGQVQGPVTEMTNGARAYFAMVNQQGGVHGRRIELRSLDDRFDPKAAALNTEILITRDKVLAMFLTRGTPQTNAVLPLIEQHQVPLIAPSTGAATLADTFNQFVFNVRAKYQKEVEMGVEQFATVGLSRISLLHVDDAFGSDALEGYVREMKRRKLDVLQSVRFNREAPNIEETIAALRSRPPQAVIIAAAAPTAAAFIKQFRLRGMAMQVMVLSNNSSQAFLDLVGADGAGVIVSQVTPPPSLLVSKLGKEFSIASKAHNLTQSYAAMEGFVAAKVLVEGLRRAGSNPTRKSLIRGLESMRNVDMGGMTVDYGEARHFGSNYVELTILNKERKFIH
ncbi:ABC transporter substrate-binding protein [Noviherbaspirillum galbum]|uniref:ABC transporter substrate-binding protein n=1 Tax=Noviherbaspirillum galbum TaxID=2709383 RepID=A0A6B3STF6_9BURK|nr:ABC transporter substrate-binding protein [Noviherbaspirillum galbum]NEX64047.1 ABC transporter substrate-binding protein [Noviherbaspirillum galbum]